MKKKKGAVMENMLVMLVGLVFSCAFLVIIFGAFSGISDKGCSRLQESIF